MNGIDRPLDEQRIEFANGRLIAMPIAGAIAWALIGFAGATLPAQQAVWVLFIGTGTTVYLGFLVSVFTGENHLSKSKPKNTFDQLFFNTTFMAWLCFGIAIPFFMEDYTSLPLSIGILAGLMWMTISWIIQHWIGIFHAVSRTVLIVAAWYIFPQDRFTAIPAVIVLVYIISIIVLEHRWRQLQKG